MKPFFKLNLTTSILLSLVIGLLIGLYFPEFAHAIKPFRSLFLNGIKCIIAPLIFSSIVVGIASSGSIKNLGGTGLRAIVYFEIATTVALFIGLLFVNLLAPGKGLNLKLAQHLPGGPLAGHLPVVTPIDVVKSGLSFAGFIEHLLPTNFADAMVRGDVLQMVILALIFGVALIHAGPKGKLMLDFCVSLNEVMFKFTGLIMYLAPIGVGAAMAGSVAEHGISVMLPLLKLILTLYLALIFFILTMLIPALIFSRVKIFEFFKALKAPLILAFSTTSSESAYPQSLEILSKIGVKNRIASFVLPLGYSFNLDGSTLYLAIASVFIAQVAGIELSLWTQLSMMLTLMLTTKGVAAVPRASLVVLSGTLVAFGLPLEGVTLILAVDEFMDMARTSVNLLGNCVATVVVSRLENEPLNPEYQYQN